MLSKAANRSAFLIGLLITKSAPDNRDDHVDYCDNMLIILIENMGQIIVSLINSFIDNQISS